jgi:hypothetical protein
MRSAALGASAFFLFFFHDSRAPAPVSGLPLPDSHVSHAGSQAVAVWHARSRPQPHRTAKRQKVSSSNHAFSFML